jgi:hypothetical protein
VRDPAADDASGAIPVPLVRELLRQLHAGASQEAAAARVALAVWRRADRAGDRATADAAATAVEARLEALFDALAALEARGKELVAQAESGRIPDGGDTRAR